MIHELVNVKPWDAQLAGLSPMEFYSMMKSEEKVVGTIEKAIKKYDSDGQRNRAIVIIPNDEEFQKFDKHIEYNEITDTIMQSGKLEAFEKKGYIGSHPESTFFIKGEKKLYNYIFDAGTVKCALEICIDHVQGVAKKLYGGKGNDRHIHFVLSSSCDHKIDNLLLIDGGLLIHCDSEYTNEEKFGIWRKEKNELISIKAKKMRKGFVCGKR